VTVMMIMMNFHLASKHSKAASSQHELDLSSHSLVQYDQFMVKPEDSSRQVSADSNPSPLRAPVSYDDKWSCHQTACCGVVTSLLQSK
jgi:hypothetical protein